jgi:acyl-coenzyme A synthetase/AMP-(fatty) acid ligase
VRDDLGIQRAPRRVIAVEEALPRTGQDKLDRRAVAALWVSQTEVSAAVPGGR